VGRNFLFINKSVSHGTPIPTDSMFNRGEHSMHIYDPISLALNIEPQKFNEEYYSIPEDVIKTKWGGSQKGKSFGAGRPIGSFDNYIFVTNGIIEKIVHKDKIPEGLYPGRIRICSPKKSIVIDGVYYESGKAASEALDISAGMVTYLRQKQETGKAPW